MPILRWAAAIALAIGCSLLLRRAGRGGDGPWARAIARLRRDRGAMLALDVLVALAGVALLAGWLSPHAPDRQLDIARLASQAPSAAHPFGTDPYSRDVLSRVLHGARVSLAVAALAALLSATLGTLWGGAAGYLGGRWDAVLTRLAEAAAAIPRLLLVIALLAVWPRPSPWGLVAVLGLTAWWPVARLVRAEVRARAGREYVAAARALGATGPRVLVRHLLPNVASAVIVAAALAVPQLVLLESGLSYLGLGVRPPAASWGAIVQDGADQVASAWWIALFPGLAIALTSLASNALADGLRDALDPRELDGR